MPIINQVVKGGGTTPTGTMYIISNGTYNVADKAIANVNVPTSGPDRYVEYVLDPQYGWLENTLDTTKFNNLVRGVTQSLYDYGLAGLCKDNQNIGAIDLSALSSIGSAIAFLARTFYYSSITSLDLSGLKIVSAADALELICAHTPLNTLKIESLQNIGGSGAFYGSFQFTQLTNVNFASLLTIPSSGFQYTFGGCNNIVLWFPNVWSINNSGIRYMLRGVSSGGNVQNATIHFPSNMEATVKALASYSDTAAFGAASSTVLFDLPAILTLTGANTVTYQRNPKYDTATALGWRDTTDNDWNPVYTSGTTDPTVNDTIYSDAACTTAVTTISSIA